MIKITKLFCFLVASLLFTSCATHFGNFNSCATLNSPNFKYVKVVKGTAEYSKILQIGGNKVDALVAQARVNMYENYPLKDNQAYSNVVVDFKNSNFLILSKTKVIITADVVEFIK